MEDGPLNHWNLESVKGVAPMIGPARALDGANTVQVSVLLNSVSDTSFGSLEMFVQVSNDGQNWGDAGSFRMSHLSVGTVSSAAFPVAASLYRTLAESTPIDNEASFAFDIALSSQ